MRRIKLPVNRSTWLAGVSDGLTLPCKRCGKIPKFDYSVDSEFWNKVISKKDRLGVVCLPCLDILATEKGLDVADYLEEIQFTGIGKTIELVPVITYYYNKDRFK